MKEQHRKTKKSTAKQRRHVKNKKQRTALKSKGKQMKTRKDKKANNGIENNNGHQ